MKLLLGTAQFGSSYGALRSETAFSDEGVSLNMLQRVIARKEFIGVETSALYGAAPEFIGKFIATLSTEEKENFFVVSKIAFSSEKHSSWDEVWDAHLRLLNCSSLYVLLLHKEEQWNDPRVQAWVEKKKNNNLLRFAGVSCYEQETMRQVFASNKYDALQIPINIFWLLPFYMRDNRDVTRSKFLMGRSVFLQGVLLSDGMNLPRYLLKFQDFLKFWNDILSRYSLSPLEGALLCAQQYEDYLDALVVGAENSAQVDRLADAFSSNIRIIKEKRDMLDDFIRDVFSVSQQVERSLTDPRKWRRG